MWAGASMITLGKTDFLTSCNHSHAILDVTDDHKSHVDASSFGRSIHKVILPFGRTPQMNLIVNAKEVYGSCTGTVVIFDEDDITRVREGERYWGFPFNKMKVL
jgi:hypothetical protein